MRNILLTLKFDGTNYHGWQVQSNAVTVQQTLQDAVETVFGKRENVVGCSRTDAGVHANKYCCNIRTENEMSSSKIVSALNANLPNDIAVTDCKDVPLEFHARYDCKSKEYLYKIWNSQVRNPFLNNYTLHYKYPIDTELLSNEAKAFLGTHDYIGFCAAGSSVKDTVRTVGRFDVSRDGDLVVFTVEANGFLYNMVRIMTGTLLYISQGKIAAGELPNIINSKNRFLAGPTAPPTGLYLNDVKY